MEITSYYRQQSTKIHSLNRQNPTFKANCPVKKEQLEFFINQGLTMKQVGERFNVSINTIRKWFTILKVETPYQKNRKLTEMIDLKEFTRLIEAGIPKQEIIEKLNITKDIYVTLLKKSGAKTLKMKHSENISAITKESLLSLMSSGKTITEIRKELGDISMEMYCKLLRKFNIETTLKKRMAHHSTITKTDITSRLEKGMTKLEIIKELDLTASKYTRLLHDFGIETSVMSDRKNASQITKERFLELINSGMLSKDIEKELGISNSTFCNLLNKFEITTTRQAERANAFNITKEELQALVDRGLTVKSMLAELNISESTFYKLIKFHNVDYKFQHHNNEIIIPKQLMEDMIQTNKPVRAIAKELNVHQTTFSNKARIARVNTTYRENIDKGASVTKEELQDAISSGFSRAEICKRYGIAISMYDTLISKFHIMTKKKMERENVQRISKELLIAMKSMGKSIENICKELNITTYTYRKIMNQP